MKCINNAFEGARAFTHMMDEINEIGIDVTPMEDTRRYAPALPDDLMEGNREQRRAAAKRMRKAMKNVRHAVK